MPQSITYGHTRILKKPSIFIKRELVNEIKSLMDILVFTVIEDVQKASCALEFDSLKAREKAVTILIQNGVRYRTGKTLVPFRLSGNVSWGIPVPEKESIKRLTFWVCPESLWAPISFTKTILGDDADGIKWEEWWKSDSAKVYQFIGEDNIYFMESLRWVFCWR